MSKNVNIANNIRRLIEIGKVRHATGMAGKMGVSKTTTTAFIKDPDSRNPTLGTFISMAESLKVEPWMLLVDNFPFESLGANPPVKHISADGYTLLRIFESCNNEQIRYAILEATKQAIKLLDERASNQIADAQAHYLTKKA